MNLHNFNSNTKSWKMYTNTLTSISGDDLLVMPSYGKDIILEVSANNDIFFKKGTITKRFDNLVSEYLDTSFNSLNSQVQYILQEISGSSVKDFITSGISNDLLIKSYDGRDIILEVSGNSEIIFKRGDFSYNLDDLIGGGGSQSSDYATYNILDITGKIIFTDNSGTSGTSGTSGGNSGSSSNIVLTSISGDIIPSINNTFKLGDISKNWSNAYIRDISTTNIDVSGKLNVVGATKLANTLEISGNVTFGGSNLYVPSSFTIDPLGHGDNTGTVLINGNLVVQGVTTTINSSVVDISDKMLVLASNASNSLQANGAGFEISGAKVNFLYNDSSATFNSSIGISISGNVVPVTNSVGSLGESGKIWDIAYIRELNVTNFTNSIDGAKIANETITSTQIMNGTILGMDISNDTITSANIRDGSILTADICDNAITFDKLAYNSVGNTRIINLAVTHEKLSSNCVQSHNIVDGTIVDGDISGNANILGSKLANNSITSDKINQANNWTFSQLTSTRANIRDVSASNIEVSGNIMPLRDISSNLGSSLKRWNKVFVDDLSVNTINGQAYSAGGGGGGGSSTSIYDTNIKILPDWTPIVEISNSLYTGQNFEFGKYIVYSNDGTTLATCLTGLTISGLQFAGRVIIYHNNGSSWVQKGQNLDGTQAQEYFGRALSLSSNGNIIAIGSSNIEPNTNRRGSVKIYSYNLSTFLWEQIGGALRNFNTNLYNNTYTEQLGNHVALSGDGTVLIVGAMESDLYSGRVISYKYEIRNTILDWYVTGIVGYLAFINDFNINTYNFSQEYFGSRVALSLDGTVMAVYAAFAPAEHGDGDNTTVSNIFYSGVTRTFKWNGSVWVQTGRFIGQTREAYPINAANFLSTGTIISLSGNGNTIAIGEPNNISNGYNNGKVSVYYWNNNDNSWNKLGADIYGEGSTLRSDNNADDEVLLGISVSLSNDGTIIAVTGFEAPYNYSSYPKKGRVYKFEGTAWNKLGHSFQEGRFIALSGDGNYLAVGNSFNSISWAEHGMNRISMSIYTLVPNKIVSLNSTNLFFNDGYSYSYKKRNIHNLNLVNNDANAVHTDFFSDFPNKFTRILYIAQNGDLYNRNNTYGSFSDIRLKENIIDATPKLQDLLKVRVVNYNLKGSTNKQIGVLAQELEEIFPGLVETENSGEKYKSVKYSCINIMLVKALQEQQVLISDMSSNINTLKDEIATLKQNMDSLLTRIQALEPNASQ